MISLHNNLSEITDKYDAFFIDLWGVIHDGIEAYDGVNECLEHLIQNNKKVIFLSNAPRRSIRAKEGLQRVGVPNNLYHHIITSGEATHDFLKSNEHDLGKNFYMIGPERDNGLMDGTGYNKTDNADQADFAIVTGFDNDDSTIEDVMPQINSCLENNLTMVCANPDIIVVRKSGVKALCAGVIAEQYQELGGEVIVFGKPHNSVYQKCFEYLGGIPKEKIAMIGDNLDTDIKGANNFGIDSYLIAGGILGQSLGIEHGQLPEIEKLEDICKLSDIFPTGVLPAFIR